MGYRQIEANDDEDFDLSGIDYEREEESGSSPEITLETIEIVGDPSGSSEEDRPGDKAPPVNDPEVMEELEDRNLLSDTFDSLDIMHPVDSAEILITRAPSIVRAVGREGERGASENDSDFTGVYETIGDALGDYLESGDAPLRGASQGGSLYSSDEILGLLNAVGLESISDDEVRLPRTEMYRMARDAERGANEEAREAHPGSYLVGEIAGSAAPAALTGGFTAEATPIIGMTGTGALEGLLTGALTGFNASDSEALPGNDQNLEDLLDDTLEGGAYGAIGGIGAGLLGDSVNSLAREGRHANALRTTAAMGRANDFPPEGEINRMLAESLRRAGLTDSFSSHPSYANRIMERADEIESVAELMRQNAEREGFLNPITVSEAYRSLGMDDLLPDVMTPEATTRAYNQLLEDATNLSTIDHESSVNRVLDALEGTVEDMRQGVGNMPEGITRHLDVGLSDLIPRTTRASLAESMAPGTRGGNILELISSLMEDEAGTGINRIVPVGSRTGIGSRPSIRQREDEEEPEETPEEILRNLGFFMGR